MRRRKWWVLGITFLILVTILGAYHQSTRPRFQFLKGTSPGKIEIITTAHTATYCETYYLSMQRSEAASTELETKKWRMDDAPRIHMFGDPMVLFWIHPEMPSERISFTNTPVFADLLIPPGTVPAVPRGTAFIVSVERQPDVFDHVRAWLWNRTHH